MCQMLGTKLIAIITYSGRNGLRFLFMGLVWGQNISWFELRSTEPYDKVRSSMNAGWGRKGHPDILWGILAFGISGHGNLTLSRTDSAVFGHSHSNLIHYMVLMWSLRDISGHDP